MILVLKWRIAIGSYLYSSFVVIIQKEKRSLYAAVKKQKVSQAQAKSKTKSKTGRKSVNRNFKVSMVLPLATKINGKRECLLDMILI